MNSDSDDEVSVFAPPAPAPSFMSLEWRRGPWPRTLPSTLAPDELMAPLLEWVQAHLPRKPRPPQMRLGDDNTFYWHAELGGYVERGKEDEYRARLAKPAPPPKASANPLTSSAPPSLTAPRPRGRQYLGANGQKISLAPALVRPPPIPRVGGAESDLAALIGAEKKSAPAGAPTYPPCEARPLWDEPIDLLTFDWAAALAEFEQSVQGVGIWDDLGADAHGPNE